MWLDEGMWMMELGCLADSHFGLGGETHLWTTMGRKRLQVFYSGSVQGVGFRYSVKALAGGFEVTGTVRNLADGRVELVAEGAKEELSAFQQAIRGSELGHFIRKEDVQWGEAEGTLRGFEIVR
jgi:acylphosphatase